jgi:hypothetical protein
MAEAKRQDEYRHRDDNGFKRHGPEPPENDSGPSPSVEEQHRATNREAGVPNPSPGRDAKPSPQR